MSFREKLLKYGTCFTLFIVPLLYFGNMYSPFASSKTFLFYGFVEILGAFWVYSLFVYRSYRLSRRQLIFFIPITLYVVWLTISGFLAVIPSLSFWSSLGRGTGLLTIYHAFLLSLIVTSLVRRDGLIYLHKLISWFINSSFIVALTIWFGDEGFNVLFKSIGAGGGGLIGNSSMAAAYLLFAIALGLFLIFSKTFKRSKKWWVGIVLSTIIFSPIFVNIYGLFVGRGILGSARGATLGIIVMFGVAVIGWMFLSKNKLLKILGIAGILISIITFSIGWSQLMKPGTYLHEKFSQVAENGTRFVFWDGAKKGIDKHPYFGYGIENYNVVFQDYFNPKMLDIKYGYEGWPDHAHNIYFDTGVAGGYPAIFLYAIFMLSIFYGIYRANKSGLLSQLQSGILWGLITGYIFQNLFVFDSMLSIMILFVLAGIIFALGENYIKEKNTKTSISLPVKNTIAFLLFVVYIPCLIFFVIMPIEKAVAYNNLIKMTIDARPSYYNELLKGSSVGNPVDVSSIAATMYKYYATNLIDIKKDKNLSPYVDADIKALTVYLDKVIDLNKNKNDYRLYISTVLLYSTEITLTEKPYDKVLRDHLFSLLDNAYKLSPTNPETYWAKANIYAWQGDLKGAEGAYKDAIAIDPSAPGSYRLLANFAKVTNNQKLYDETMAESEKNNTGFKL